MSKLMGILLTILFVLFPYDIKKGVFLGLENSLKALFPSLFPYMVISSVFHYTGGLSVVSEIIYKIIYKITGISKNASGAYILSLFCGYPTGARLSSELYKENKISKEEMQKLFCFASIPGFGFCISYLESMYQSGLKMYLSFVLSSLIINFFISKKSDVTVLYAKKEETYLSIGESITKSVISSSKSMLSIIGFVCFFSGLGEILKKISGNNITGSILCGFLEITAGNTEIYNFIPHYAGKYLSVFLTGFGGFSIIFQSLSFSKNDISIIHFILARFIFALISLIIFFILGGLL